MKHITRTLMAVSMLAAQLAPAQAQGRLAVSGFAAPVPYPRANAAQVAEHFNKSRKLAGDDLFVFFDTLCGQV